MTIKFHTIQDPPPVLAEPKSELPDECRQSDFVPLTTLLERFIASGAQITEYFGAQSLSAEEKEALFDGTEVDDLDDDIAVQKSFMDEIVASSQVKKESKPTQAEPVPEQPKADEPKE